MSSTDDDTTVPAAPPAPNAGRRPFPRWGAAALAALALFVVGYLVLTTVQVGYFVQSPGSAVAVGPRLDVEGAPSYPSDGEVHFTTVRIGRERATLLDVIGDWLDPASVLVADDRILQGRTIDENRTFNQALMQDSQELAKHVALEYLGLDVIRSDGALVSQVLEGTPADGVLEPGDVVVAAAGETVTDAAGLVSAIGERQPGDELELEVRPVGAAEDDAAEDDAAEDDAAEDDAAEDDAAEDDAAEDDAAEDDAAETVAVTLGEHDTEDRAFLGVAIADNFATVDLPFEVDVDTRTVGGPSAGLALTLAIIDVLTDGELTGGLQVATTGTIGVDGAVGPIGGVEQKAHAVRRAGIDVFIVPSVDVERARAVLGDSVEVVGVDTLEQAIDALGELGGETEALALPADLGPAA